MRLVHRKHKFKVVSDQVVLLDIGEEVGYTELTDEQLGNIPLTMKKVGAENLKVKILAKRKWEIRQSERLGYLDDSLPDLEITLKYLG